MAENSQIELPWWMPHWLWRASRTAWFGSVAFGFVVYFLLSLINDFTGSIPLWVRLTAQVLAILIARLCMALLY